MRFAQTPIWAWFKTRGRQTRHRQATFLKKDTSKRGMNQSHQVTDTTTYDKQRRGEGYNGRDSGRDDRSRNEIPTGRREIHATGEGLHQSA